MSMFEDFGTDPELEAKGTWIEYDSFRVLMARAGGSNVAWSKAVAKHGAPFARAERKSKLNEKVAVNIVKASLADGCVKAWEVRVIDRKYKDDEPLEVCDDTVPKWRWESGIEQPDGTIAPFNGQNVLKVFNNPRLQDLYRDLYAQAQAMQNYQTEAQEAIAGN